MCQLLLLLALYSALMNERFNKRARLTHSCTLSLYSSRRTQYFTVYFIGFPQSHGIYQEIKTDERFLPQNYASVAFFRITKRNETGGTQRTHCIHIVVYLQSNKRKTNRIACCKDAAAVAVTRKRCSMQKGATTTEITC